MGKPRGCYSKKELYIALERASSAETHAHVAATSPVSLHTLFKKRKELRETGSLTIKRRGPKPLISSETEDDIVEWIAAMQRAGLPPTRREIIRRANQIRERLDHVSTRSAESLVRLTSGWYKRFRGRHPELADRRAQTLARVRNSVDEAVVDTLFGTLAKLVIEHKVGPTRMFNMDETSFTPDMSTKAVVAMKRSPNEWTKEMKASFHMTVVAAIHAAGYATAPQIIVPGMRILRTDIAALTIPKHLSHGGPKRVQQSSRLRLWLHHFQRELIQKHRVPSHPRA